MRCRAFSLIEVLTCVGILGILVGLMLPVARSVRQGAKMSASLSNMRQFHLALKVYQADYDGEGRYGTPDQMGLPPVAYVTLNRFGTPLSMWQSPCGQNFAWHPKPIVIQYEYYPGTATEKTFVEQALTLKEDILMFDDMNCSDDYESLQNPELSHRGLGVLLSGRLLNLKKPGRPQTLEWWTND